MIEKNCMKSMKKWSSFPLKKLDSNDNIIKDLEKKCQQLTDELKAKDERIRLLEDNCNHLMAKNSSMEKQMTSENTF